jgi:hypothetical protein
MDRVGSSLRSEQAIPNWERSKSQGAQTRNEWQVQNHQKFHSLQYQSQRGWRE